MFSAKIGSCFLIDVVKCWFAEGYSWVLTGEVQIVVEKLGKSFDCW